MIQREEISAIFGLSFLLFIGVVSAQVVDTESPSAPTNLSGSPSTSSVFLFWTASTDGVGVTSYTISRNGSVIGQNISSTSTPSTSYFDSGLASSTTYSYSVIAYDAALNASLPTETTVTTTTPPPPPPLTGDTQPPTTPTGLSASPTYSSLGGGLGFDGVNLSWNVSTDNVGVVGYKISRDKTLAGTGTHQIGTTANKTFWDYGANGLTTYTYTVVAYDKAGNNSPVTTITVTTPLGRGASVTTITKTTLYWNMTSPLKVTGSQPAGVTGMIMSGPYTVIPNKITKNSRPVTYYQINFPPESVSGPSSSAGPDGWAGQTKIQGTAY